MPYSTPVDTGSDEYVLVLRHNDSKILAELKLAGTEDGSNPSRATKDAVFQAAVNKMATLTGTTLLAARRSMNYASDVTPS